MGFRTLAQVHAEDEFQREEIKEAMPSTLSVVWSVRVESTDYRVVKVRVMQALMSFIRHN